MTVLFAVFGLGHFSLLSIHSGPWQANRVAVCIFSVSATAESDLNVSAVPGHDPGEAAVRLRAGATVFAGQTLPRPAQHR